MTPQGRLSLILSLALVAIGAFAGTAAWRSWNRPGAPEPSRQIPSRTEAVQSDVSQRETSQAEAFEAAASTLTATASDPVATAVGAALVAEHPAPIPTKPALEVEPTAASTADTLDPAFEVVPGVSAGPRLAVDPGSAPLEPDAVERVRRAFDPPRSRERFEAARTRIGMIDSGSAPRLSEWRNPSEGNVQVATPGRVRVEYTFDEELMERVFEILRRGRVAKGHAIVLDPRSGRLLAYVSTDEDGLPAEKAYPAASIVKILTAAAVLEGDERADAASCVYLGNKYRLNRRRLVPPKQGRHANLETALASSNNQCFAQWALHSVGETRLHETLARFGWLDSPAPGHEPGRVDALETDLDLGRLGSGLDGLRVTPLHVAQLASILTHGEWIEPWWVERVVDAYGRTLRLDERRPNRRVLSRDIADRLRSMLVATTKRGTAKSAFRDRRGRPRVGSIDVAGKTGNLTGWDPYGRYEWFLGLAPAEDPRVAVVVLQLQGHMWWRRSSELASDVLRAVFCDQQGCRPEYADRWTGDPERSTTPQMISLLGRPRVVGDSE